MVNLNQKKIRQALDAAPHRIFTFAELSSFVRDNLSDWNGEEIADSAALTVKTTEVKSVIDALVKSHVLARAVLPFPYRQDVRYLFGEIDLLDLIQSLNHEGYFSHFTAISLNGLTDQVPKTVYFNIEQRLSGGDGQLTQEAIDRAFKAEPRVSSNAVEYKGTRIVKINGRNAQQLGVATMNRSQAGALRITDIERTLIDATVRPAYAGGIAVVAAAFERARDSISVNKLAAYLRKLRYVYPYHQAVGFYMERAGYGEPLLKLIERFPIEHNFYLQHAIRSPVLNKRWRLFAPKGF